MRAQGNFAANQLLLHPMPAQFIHEDDRDRRIQELEAEVKAMRNAEARYRGIIENMELGIMEVDSEERVVRAHPRFCEIVGYSEEELTGKRASALLLDEEARANMDAVTASRNAGDSGLYETPIRTKQGELKWLLISGVPIHNPDGDIIGSMGIHYDITEQGDEQRMACAMQDAEAARQTEREFLARISHEIRTPMTAILGMPVFGGYVHERGTALAVEGHVGRGEAFKQLLDGVLNLTRLDAGRMEVKETVDVAALVSGVVAPFRPPLAEKSRVDGVVPRRGPTALDGSVHPSADELARKCSQVHGQVPFLWKSVWWPKPAKNENCTRRDGLRSGHPRGRPGCRVPAFHQASNRGVQGRVWDSIVKDIVALVEENCHREVSGGRGTWFDLIWPTATAETQENRILVTMSDDGRLEAMC